MSIDLISASILFFAVSGIPGLFLPPSSPWIGRIHVFLVGIGAILGLAGAVLAFLFPNADQYLFPWPAVQGSFVSVDALSAFFLFPIFLVGSLGAVYGLGYWPVRSHMRTAGRLRFFWGLIISGITVLIISKHALSFLLGWETMALAAFFLISSEDGKSESRKSALIYIIATHLGTLILFGFFTLWRVATGSFDLSPASTGVVSVATANILFFLAFFGFGLKAGIMPLHFWLPGAHANAPSHVSALLSGVMLKMGIYGIVRVLTLLPDISPFWGWAVLFLGAASGLLGVIYALAQHDLKRLLAYHSVENIGIILLGLGMAILGRSQNRDEWIVLGMAGCLLHVWNHSLFKSLLFFGSGSVLHATGTRQIDRLGGLAQKMPLTALLFLVGAAAISGLPPLNGFISEFFIYIGFFGSAATAAKTTTLALLGVPVLAMIGALAVSCFVKAYGAVFSGNPRTDDARKAREAPLSMTIPMIILGILCLGIGLFPILTVPFLEKAIAVWQGGGNAGPLSLSIGSLVPFDAIAPLMGITLLAIVAVYGIFMAYKRRLVARQGTWDCGYAKPTERMQYTAASFARSLVGLFRKILKPKEHLPLISGPFPESSSLESHVEDSVLDRFLRPKFRLIRSGLRWFYRFQQGQTQSYILYLVVVLGILFGTQIPFRELLTALFTK